jgi:hypothetical protein
MRLPGGPRRPGANATNWEFAGREPEAPLHAPRVDKAPLVGSIRSWPPFDARLLIQGSRIGAVTAHAGQRRLTKQRCFTDDQRTRGTICCVRNEPAGLFAVFGWRLPEIPVLIPDKATLPRLATEVRSIRPDTLRHLAIRCRGEEIGVEPRKNSNADRSSFVS